MKLLDSLKKIIEKDTPTANESKKMAVLIRIECIILMAYFVLNSVVFFMFGKYRAIGGNLLMFLLYAVVFALTFKLKKMATVSVFIFVTSFWAVIMLWLYGPGLCFQIIPPFLIIIFFFASYDSFQRKIIFTLCTFVVYLGALFIYGTRPPLLQVSIFDQYYIMNSGMFVIMLCTCVAAHVFSKDSQDQERKLIVYNRRLEEKASTDSLTGLNNRGRAMDYLDEISKIADEIICSICICDIDHFKIVNDSYGHDVGDLVLKTVADVLSDNAGEGGFVARWGGEEFFLAFPNMNGDDAYAVLLNIQNKMKDACVKVRDEDIRVTLTYGLTEYDKSKSINDNIKEADKLLYMGKEQGRNRIVY
ncbi:MAG: GGDEF domain-containing protein [Lachnospiraceae bacterium]|nr:GGDEF domain-containing protein [Lachnospiraceae bacterium]